MHKSLADTYPKPITAEELNLARKEAKEFEKAGGNICLYWAGQLASAAGKVHLATPAALSAALITLEKFRQEYDRAIISKLPKKKK